MRKIDDYEYLHLLAESRGHESDDLAPAVGFLTGMACMVGVAVLIKLTMEIWRMAR